MTHSGMKIYDISLALSPNLPVWPGVPRVMITKTKSFDAGHEVNCSHLSCDVHSGTHLDAPSHFLHSGSTVDEIPLEVLIGPVQVGYLPEVDEISPAELEGLELPPGTRRLLLRTRNSTEWARGSTEFIPHFVALTPQAAEWVVTRGIQLVGVDYLSAQRFFDSEPATHRTLLRASVVIVEGLNLHEVPAGQYNLICLPIKLMGAEGAPARAVLIQD